ncbi:MAG: DUF1802 family protein [Actinobacteria bacterium]|nr:DUF1802 family protein [Actinomycetota bacterium]
MAIPAFKEWAIIVDALLSGEQIIDVRKGGLREEGRHFGVQARRFWLYPTYLHQRADLVKPAYRHALDRILEEAPPDDLVRVPGWAEVVGVATLTEPDQLAALDSKFIWTLDYADARLKWKKRDPLWVLALRVHCLDEPVEVPFDEAYAGCTSWVDPFGLAADPEALAASPALTDEAFEARLKFLADSLPTPLEEPAEV